MRLSANHKFVLCWMLASISFQAFSNPILLAEGQAYKQDTDTLLYIEKYFQEENDKQTVIYYAPNGNEFARKTLDFSATSIAPLFKLENTNAGELIHVASSGNNKVKLSYRKSKNTNIKESEIQLNESIVIDAGFDNFVRRHWDQLIAGTSMDFNFLVPSFGRTVALLIRKVDCNQSKLCLEISPRNLLISIFSTKITLHYDQTDKKLVFFSGRGNIADQHGKYSSVSINYQHYSNINGEIIE